MRGSSIGLIVVVLLAVAIAAFLLAPGSGRVDTSASSRSPVHWKEKMRLGGPFLEPADN